MRVRSGQPPALTTAARLHSEDMAKYSYFSHTSRDGRSPWQRMRAQGYYYGSAENIAAGYTTATSVMIGVDEQHGAPQEHPQLLEQGHGGRHRHGGIYGIYWTQDFGTR